MTRSLSILVLVVLACPLFGFGPKEPKGRKLERYESSVGKFRVMLPHDPHESRIMLATAIGPVRVTTVRGEVHRDLVLAVTFADYPDAFARASATRIFDSVRDGLKGIDGTIVAEQDREYGRDFRVNAGRNQIRCRVLLIGSRLYQVMATGSSEAVRSRAADTFFDSFELTK